jgi:predicted O-methyltransferase YrrM
MPDDEGVALYDAAVAACRAARAPWIVEVGAWCGKSTVYLGAAAEACGGIVLSVDHHHGSEELQEGWDDFDPELVDPHDGRINTLPTWQRTIADAGLEACVVGLVGDSVTVARHVRQGITFCFIDGGHGHDVAWADYRAWVPLIDEASTLAIHDVFEDPRDGGRPPYLLYRDALSSGFTEVTATGSLRVLRRSGGRAGQ